MLTYIFREGTSNDKEQLKRLGLVSYRQFKSLLTEDDWAKLNSTLASEDLYSNLLKISKCFVCEDNREIIGMAFFIPQGNPTEIFQSDWSYIRMVGVNPSSAGNGIGKQLTKMCIDLAKSSNEHTVALHTSEFMDAARHIYESLGFKQIKELTARYGKRYWLYKLEL